MPKIVLEHAFEITDEDISNVITTAVEGGIGYWSKVENYKPINDDGSFAILTELRLHPEVPGDFDPHTITTNNILDGIRQFCELRNCTPDNLFGDDGDYDAGDADLIIQFAMFGEIIYA